MFGTGDGLKGVTTEYIKIKLVHLINFCERFLYLLFKCNPESYIQTRKAETIV
jgi:hypothetical protein